MGESHISLNICLIMIIIISSSSSSSVKDSYIIIWHGFVGLDIIKQQILFSSF